MVSILSISACAFKRALGGEIGDDTAEEREMIQKAASRLPSPTMVPTAAAGQKSPTSRDLFPVSVAHPRVPQPDDERHVGLEFVQLEFDLLRDTKHGRSLLQGRRSFAASSASINGGRQPDSPSKLSEAQSGKRENNISIGTEKPLQQTAVELWNKNGEWCRTKK